MSEKSRILKKINQDSFGGSENHLRLLLKYLPDENCIDINLILNNTFHQNIYFRSWLFWTPLSSTLDFKES